MRNFRLDCSRGNDAKAMAEAIASFEVREMTSEDDERYAEAVFVGRIVEGAVSKLGYT